MLNLDEFFRQAQGLEYVLIKRERFPQYASGSDLDILCSSRRKWAESVLKLGNRYIELGYDIEVHVKTTEPHTYIDFHRAGRLELRFDIMEGLPPYRNVTVDPSYIKDILANRTSCEHSLGENRYALSIPCDTDELVLRYLEYLEWHDVRPDKRKHLDYVRKAMVNGADAVTFLERLERAANIECPELTQSTMA